MRTRITIPRSAVRSHMDEIVLIRKYLCRYVNSEALGSMAEIPQGIDWFWRDYPAYNRK